MKKIRLLLVDDHSLLRIGLNTLLNVQKDMEVVGEAEDGESVIRLAQKLKPDVVIMDLMMPVMGGAEATAKIRSRLPGTQILVLTSFGTSAEVVRAVRNGATGVFLKDAPNEDLLVAIRDAAAGIEVFSRDVRQLIASSADLPDLTPRQLEMLAAAAQGLTTEAIAARQKISVDGVKKHFSSIFHKLGASSRSEAVAIGIRKHLLKA